VEAICKIRETGSLFDNPPGLEMLTVVAVAEQKMERPVLASAQLTTGVIRVGEKSLVVSGAGLYGAED